MVGAADGRDSLENPFREPVEAPLPPRNKPTGKKQAEDIFAGWTQEVVGEMIAAGFAGVSVVTGREHWTRSAKQVEPITKPLCNIIAKLPPEAIKRLEKHSDALALLGGAVAVAWPSVLAEVYYYQGLRDARNHALSQAQSGQPPLQQQRDLAASGADYTRLNGNGGQASAATESHGAAHAPTGTRLAGLVHR